MLHSGIFSIWPEVLYFSIPIKIGISHLLDIILIKTICFLTPTKICYIFNIKFTMSSFSHAGHGISKESKSDIPSLGRFQRVTIK